MTEQPSGLRATELRNPRSEAVDELDPLALVDLFVSEDIRVPLAVAGARESIAATLAMLVETFTQGGRLFYVGAGTSGRLGVLDASECPPTFGTNPEMVQGIIAGGNDALVRSIEGAEDNADVGAGVIDQRGVRANDIVIGIAASGGTPFVVAALERARFLNARTAFITCSRPEDSIAAHCDVVIQLDVGPEIVTGSTRLKAGTATKLVLNILTTGAMIRIGKTWGNYMVDLQATNAKLRDRGERILMTTLKVDRLTAREAILAANGRVRTAIVMLHEGIDPKSAEELLERAGNRLTQIIGAPPHE